MNLFKNSVCIALAVAISALPLGNRVLAKESETDRIIRDAQDRAATPVQSVNDFIQHSAPVGSAKPDMVKTSEGRIYVQLLTPLNSSFNHSGDDVRAVVIGSQNKDGKPWLQEGAILEGQVEDAKKATYAQTDGSLVVRFYDVNIDNHRIEIFTTPDTDDHTLKPSPVRLLTKKQKVRGILMTATRIAVPAAIGSGGLSIAITAGAGAAIGLAFSEKGKRIQGTVRGAWEGAGLTVLDPLVCKGRSVVLPADAVLQLQITESVIAPKYVAHKTTTSTSTNLALNAGKTSEATSITQLSTHATIVKNSSNNSTGETDAQATTQIETTDPLALVNKKIAQNDLAAAITALNEAEQLYPDDQNVKEMHKKIFDMVSGQKVAGAENRSNH